MKLTPGKAYSNDNPLYFTDEHLGSYSIKKTSGEMVYRHGEREKNIPWGTHLQISIIWTAREIK